MSKDVVWSHKVPGVLCAPLAEFSGECAPSTTIWGFLYKNTEPIILSLVSLLGHSHFMAPVQFPVPSNTFSGRRNSSNWPTDESQFKENDFPLTRNHEGKPSLHGLPILPQQAKQGAVQINKPTCNVDLLGVGGDGCGRDRAVGEVAPRAIVDVLHLGLQLAQPQHDVIQQHSQGLLQVCESESTSSVLCPSRH